MYGPIEKVVEEREKSWIDLDRVEDTECKGYRLCVMGDLNEWIGDNVSVSITGTFGFLRENDNGRRGVDFCEENGLFVGYTYFKHKYTCTLVWLEAKIK